MAPGGWCAPRPTSLNLLSWLRVRFPKRACAKCSNRSMRCCARIPKSAPITRRFSPLFSHRCEKSARLLLKGCTELVRRIDAENAHFLRIEREFLESEDKFALIGMTLDVGIELSREEIAFDHVAFELGHVDAVGGKAAERLVESGGYVAHPEQEGRDDRAVAVAGPNRFT